MHIYSFLIWLAAFFHPKAKKFSAGRKGLFSRLQSTFDKEANGSVVWMHCASLGEFEQGRPVLEAIRSQFPGYSLLLTFFSPSGYEVRKNYKGADWVFYLPLDSKRNAARFLDLVQPKVALFVKYEFWYHYLHGLHIRKIPAVLFSAHFQSNQPFFKSWGTLFRKMLSFYRQIFVQDASSEKLLQSIGVNTAQIAGDTRLDRAAKVLDTEKRFPNVETFKQENRLIVVGSSWPEDESFLKEVLGLLSNGQYKLLLAPHEVQGQNIQRILKFFDCEACLWDASADALKEKKVAVVHTIGQLSYLYRYADVAWLGGGFGKGIHNIIEPAVFCKPVCFGPRFERFKEAVELCHLGAAATFEDASGFVKLLSDENKLHQMGRLAGAYVTRHTGATKKIMGYLAEKCLVSTS